MIDMSVLPRHRVLCIDMKSFFASVEAVQLGLDPLTAHVAVVSDVRRSGSFVLAASPAMKTDFNVRTGSRLYEIPRSGQIRLVPARMGLYLDISVAITRLLNRFAPLEAIHPYSIDESWICLDGTEKLFGTATQAAEQIRKCILMEFGLPSAIGIGPNKLLAKLILDNYAKETGLAACDYEDVPRLLWPLPVERIWGIGRRMTKNLNRLGIVALGDLAGYSLPKLQSKFGIMGEQLYYHAWGVDLSPVFADPRDETRKGFSNGITLFRDYTVDEVSVVIGELADLIASRMRKLHTAGRTVSLSIGYNKQESSAHFSRSRTLPESTNLAKYLNRACLSLLAETKQPTGIRTVHISVSNLVGSDHIQQSLFDPEDDKLYKLAGALDTIHDRYGRAAVVRARSLTEAGTATDRANKIGGHYR